MGALIGGRLAIEGRLARFVYVSLYQMHLNRPGFAGGSIS
jgi:NADH dehydrogenase